MSTTTAPYGIIDDQTVMDGFHLFLSKSLGQAKAERLLDEQTLASAEADIMVAGPALCFYFAALRSATNPPSIPIPRFGLPRDTPPLILNNDTVSPTFRPFFNIWSTLTPHIQELAPEEKHDLARIICGHEPLNPSSPNIDRMKRVALDLRAVAIEVSQRRTFQERYQQDLQAALDHGRPMSPDGRRTPSPLRATFVPPPGYEAEKPLPLSPPESRHSTPRTNPRPLTPTSPTGGFHITNPDSAAARPSAAVPPSPPRSTSAIAGSASRHNRTASAQSASMFLEPPGGVTSPTRSDRPVPPIPSSSSSAGPSTSQHARRPSSPSILTAHDPAILKIRETLYAALADVLSRNPEVRGLLKTDPQRAYFASVALAILEFSLSSLTPEGNVIGVLGQELRLKDIPRSYTPFMQELQAIAVRTRELEAEDNQKAIELLTAGEDELPEPRMDRVRRMLVIGVARGWEEIQRDQGLLPAENDLMANAAFETQHRRSSRDPAVRRGRSRDRSPAGTVLQLANRINGLALGMMRLPAFQERQNDVFKVLAGVR